MGAKKFEEYLERSGAARNIVTDRLNKLCIAGILAKHLYQEKPDRFEYRLTDKGKDLYPVLVGLLAFGDKWHADGGGQPLELTHKACAKLTRAIPHCSECKEPMEFGGARPHLRDPSRPYWFVE